MAWREAVAEVATKAHAKLPECNGRVDSAVKIVLAACRRELFDHRLRRIVHLAHEQKIPNRR